MEELEPAVDASTGEAEPPHKPKALEGEHWYVGAVSERKAEKILSQHGIAGGFLVRDSLLPDADYVLSVNSGHEIWHYDINFLTKDECIFNKYSFPSISEIIEFYSENRLGKVFLEPPEKPLVSEIVAKSAASRIKLAPKSVKQADPRFSPIIKRAFPANGTNKAEQVSEAGSSGKDDSVSIAGKPDEASLDERTPDSLHQPRVSSDGENKASDIVSEPVQDDKNSHSSAKEMESERKPASPATIIRHNSRAAILSELRRLPSIKKTRVLVRRRIQGSDSDDDTDSDDELSPEDEKETSRKPPPPPLPVRTTPTLTSPVHGKQKSSDNKLPEASANKDSPAVSSSASSSPPLLKPPESPIPLVTLSDDENSPIGDVILFAPNTSQKVHPTTATKPHELASSDGSEDSLPSISNSSDSPPTHPSKPAVAPPSTGNKPSSPIPPPRKSPDVLKRRSIQIPLESDTAPGDQEDEDMPPPPPMSTHPEVMKASNLPRNFHTEKPEDLPTSKIATDQEEKDTPQPPQMSAHPDVKAITDIHTEDPVDLPATKPTAEKDDVMPPPPPMSTHPDIIKARTLPRNFHTEQPADLPTARPIANQKDESMPSPPPMSTHPDIKARTLPRNFHAEEPSGVPSSKPTIKPSPRPRNTLSGRGRIKSEPNTSAGFTTKESIESIPPPSYQDIQCIPETDNSSQVVDATTPTVPDDPSLQAASSHDPSLVDDTFDPSLRATALSQPQEPQQQQQQQHQQPATEGSVGEPKGEDPPAQSAIPGHAFFFTTTSAAGSKPVLPEEGAGEWSGPLSVSGPTNVESLMKCGPMNSKRTGPPVKKKRSSILRRKK